MNSSEELAKLNELQALYKERDDLEKSEQLKERDKETFGQTAKRYVGHAARTAVGGVSDLADIPRIPLNIGRYFAGADIPEGYGELARKKFDALTSEKYRPKTGGGELVDAIGSAVIGGGGIGAVGNLLTKIPKLAKIGKALYTGNQLNVRNVAGTAAGVGTAHELIKKNPDSPLSAILAGIVAGHYGGKAAAGIGKVPAKMSKARLEAAIRNPHYGKELEEAFPTYFGFGKDTHVSYEKAGGLSKKAATNLETKKSNYFSKAYDTLKDDFDDAAGSMPGSRMVDVSPAIDFISHKYVNDFSKDAATQKLFFKSPLARELSSLIDVPLRDLDPNLMKTIVQNGLPPQYTHMDIDAVFTLRKNLDSLIKSKEWNHIGADKDSLTKVRGILDSVREKGFEKVSPSLAERLKAVNTEYKDYLSNEAQYLNRIKDEGSNLAGVYKKSFGDINESGLDLGYTLRELSPDEKSIYLKRILRDMGKTTEKGVSSNRLADKFNTLEPEVQKQIFSALPERDLRDLQDLLSAQKGYKKVIGEDVNIADIGMRAHALGKEASWKSAQLRKLLTRGLNTPEGKKRAVNLLLEEGRNINPNPAHGIAPLHTLRESGTKRFMPHSIRNLPEKALKSPGLAQQLGVVSNLYHNPNSIS